MKYQVRVIANAKLSLIEETGPQALKMKVKSPAKEGKANEEVIKLLSGYFKVPKSQIEILKGQSSKNKIIEVIKS